METAPPARMVYDPDTGPMPDERLVMLVRQSDLKPARDELLARTARQRSNLLRRLARDAGLTEADRSDVQQEAVLWTLEAIQHYDHKSVTPGGCSFRSFLHRVIACRFIDFLRQRLRYRRLFVHVGATLPSEFDGPGVVHRPVAAYPAARAPEPEPQQRFEEMELSDRLQRQLDRLGAQSRRLWELMARGASVAEISQVLYISYDAAKRRRHKLLRQLRKSLMSGR